MIIHSRHIDEFKRRSDEKLTTGLLAHVQRFYSGQCQALGEEETRGSVDYGVRQARSYGFTTHSQIRRFIDLLFCFGATFDQPDGYPWARQILNRKDLNPGERSELLMLTAHLALANSEQEREHGGS